MACLSRKLLFVLLTLSPVFYDFVTTQERLTCEKINSCSCQLSNGEVVDLSPLAYTELIAAGENSIYQLFLCNPRDYGDGESTCSRENDVVICEQMSVGEGVYIYFNWGRQYTASYTVSNPYPLQIEILYRFGDSDRNSTLNVLCDENDVGTLSMLGVYNKHAEFVLHTKYGCPGYRDAAISAPVLFILLTLGLIAFALYFLIGAAVNWKVKGAKGIETIPNFDFWKASPVLFIDGFYLLGAPICQCARDNLSKRSASYAQI